MKDIVSRGGGMFKSCMGNCWGGDFGKGGRDGGWSSYGGGCGDFGGRGGFYGGGWDGGRFDSWDCYGDCLLDCSYDWYVVLGGVRYGEKDKSKNCSCSYSWSFSWFRVYSCSRSCSYECYSDSRGRDCSRFLVSCRLYFLDGGWGGWW